MRIENEICKKLFDGENIFLTGGAGVGKTYTTNEIIKIYATENKKVIKLASTAMAATHIGGQTLHSFFVLEYLQIYMIYKTMESMR